MLDQVTWRSEHTTNAMTDCGERFDSWQRLAERNAGCGNKGLERGHDRRYCLGSEQMFTQTKWQFLKKLLT
jgi:hypothetical protein